MKKIISTTKAINLINDNDVIASSGFRWSGSPELLLSELGSKYEKNKSPKNLTLIFSSAQGDSVSNGLENLAHKGLLKRVIGGFWGINPKLVELAKNNHIEAYNVPQGVIARLFSSIASKSPGLITKTGLGTYIDPRNEGGKLNEITKDNLIEVIKICGEEYLLYKSQKIDIGFIRGTVSDNNGNLSIEKEGAVLEILPLAMAVHNSGGKVIAQVESLTDNGKINPKNVVVPGYLIDYLVLSKDSKSDHRQSCKYVYEPSLAGNYSKKQSKISVNDPTNKIERQIIAKRAIEELNDGDIINLGQGIPTDIIPLLQNNTNLKNVNFTLESGVSGGVPLAVPDFGISDKPESMIRPDDMFMLFNGGGLDVSFLGFAQIDQKGKVNVSKFGNNFVGCGGFIDIAQNTKKLIFCGCFNAKGLDVKIENANLIIRSEGELKKFINNVDQITYNPKFALSKKQILKIITERCVFEYKEGRLELTEIMQGINLETQILSQIEFDIKVSSKLKVMRIQ
jgi:propionate CoA-transferase